MKRETSETIVLNQRGAMLYAIRLNLKLMLSLMLCVLVAPPIGILSRTLPGYAHETEISGEVGATIHIEPNDNPRAGVASLAWFALTRRGGQLIPLSECHCQLAVYAQPYQEGNAPIQQPSLTTISAEGHEGIPGAEITFPQAGAYELVLTGDPVTTGTFSPFKLRFSVTVAQ